MKEALAANTVISHYRILSRVGVGGMGEVYLAEDTSLRRKVALKLLSAELTKNEDRLRRFEHEAFAASALSHPNILVIHKIGSEGDMHFIATEFIEGDTLRDHIARSKMGLREILDVAIQTLNSQTISHNRIIKKLGGGGTGDARMAEDASLGRKLSRLLTWGIVTCLISLNLFAFQPVYPSATSVRFAEHTIATDLNGGYQVVVSDINHDGKPDLIAVASGMKELIWFENPGWQRHVIVGNISGPINCAAWDIDGDGIPEIALAHEFSSDPARSIGIVSLLKHKADPSQPWEMIEIDRLSTSHRLRWLDMDGNGKKVLVNAPLAGALVKPPDYKGAVPIVFYRPGLWKREIISQELEGVLHGLVVTDWDKDGREDILTASFVGVDLFSFGKNKGWVRSRIVNGNPDPWPRSGSSEIAVGRLGRDRFFCTIEPWHGNQVVVYSQEGRGWQRQVIDSSLNDGHVLLTADLNQDGRDEIIAGYRGQGRSVYIYSADDLKGSRWSRQVLDDGGIGAAGCAVADLNGDTRPDVACIGTATTNLKWYENLGPASRMK